MRVVLCILLFIILELSSLIDVTAGNARNGIVSIPRTMANSRIMGRVNRAILSSDSEDDDENIEVDEASSDIDERKEVRKLSSLCNIN